MKTSKHQRREQRIARVFITHARRYGKAQPNNAVALLVRAEQILRAAGLADEAADVIVERRLACNRIEQDRRIAAVQSQHS